MDHHRLFTIDGPALLVLPASPSDVADLMIGWLQDHPDWQVLRVRGEKPPPTQRS